MTKGYKIMARLGMTVQDKLYYVSEYYEVTEEGGVEYVVFGQENHLPTELRYWPKRPKWP
jgi:hypothetical protein